MYSLNVISNRPHLYGDIVSSLTPERVAYFDGSGYPSFSSIVNRCVAGSSAEYVIIMSDKVKPRKEHVDWTINLLNRGYGFVALYRFAFFACSKELFRLIGGLDENYVGGGYEDDDFYIRLVESDIALWVTHDVPYTAAPSSWNPEKAREYHNSKWIIDTDARQIIRRRPEPKFPWDLGPRRNTKFLQGRYHSYTPLPQVAQYFFCNIKGLDNA